MLTTVMMGGVKSLEIPWHVRVVGNNPGWLGKGHLPLLGPDGSIFSHRCKMKRYKLYHVVFVRFCQQKYFFSARLMQMFPSAFFLLSKHIKLSSSTRVFTSPEINGINLAKDTVSDSKQLHLKPNGGPFRSHPKTTQCYQGNWGFNKELLYSHQVSFNKALLTPYSWRSGSFRGGS